MYTNNRALSEVSGQDVKAVMDNWTGVMGFPVITVVFNEDGTLHARQNRFLSSGEASGEEDKTLWCVPVITLSDNQDGSSRFLFREREAVLPVRIGSNK